MERTKDEVEKILLEVLIENRELREEMEKTREASTYWYNAYLKVTATNAEENGHE